MFRPGVLTNIAAMGEVVPAINGTLVYRTSDLTTQDYSTGTPVITWQAEAYDVLGAMNIGGSPTKFIVPVALNGHYGIFSARVALSSISNGSMANIGILKNGSTTYTGRAGQLRETGSGGDGVASTTWMQCQTQPIPLTTGDEFEVHVRSTDASVTFESEKSSFSLLAFPTVTGCLVKKSVDQTAANFSAFATLTWDTDVHDADGAHDTGSNTSRITIPAGWNGKYGIFRGNARYTSVSTSIAAGLYVLKGGATTWDGMGASQMEIGSSNEAWIEAESQPVLLATGEIYELRAFCADTSVTVEEESTTFGVMVFDTVQGCLAKKAADQTTANYSTAAAVAWTGTDIYDTDAIHDPSSNNTKLIIPPALNGLYAIVKANISGSLVTAESTVSLKITKNGQSEYIGCGQESRDTGNTASTRIQCATQPILLTTGDEFEAVFYCSDTSITVAAAESSFGLMVIEP